MPGPGNIIVEKGRNNLIHCRFFAEVAVFALAVAACGQESPATGDPPSTDSPIGIIYQLDGRKVVYSDPLPLAIDLHADDTVDFTIFIQETVQGGLLNVNAGINPILSQKAQNHVVSGMPIEENFQNMGYVREYSLNTLIETSTPIEFEWTMEHAALAIERWDNNNLFSAHGAWADGQPKLLAFSHTQGSGSEQTQYFGWMRLRFDSASESATLVDYAYLNVTKGGSIRAGER